MKLTLKKYSFLILIILFYVVNSTSQDNIYAEINADSAFSLVQNNNDNPNFIILDIRTPNEYTPDHIKNGVNLNYYNSDFKQTLDTLIKNKTYLIHCRSGSRSRKAFKIMKDLNFAKVYNMKGGISAWKNKSFPTTDIFSPIIKSVSRDTSFTLEIDDEKAKDTISITITNFGNDTLKFSSISNINNTGFTTDFDISKSLTGFDDYTFNIIYSITTNTKDSIDFTIESNGGELNYTVFGKNKSTNYISQVKDFAFNIYPNPSNGDFSIELGEDFYNANINLYDNFGKLIMTKSIINSNLIGLDLNSLPNGIYIINVRTQFKSTTKRIIIN